MCETCRWHDALEVIDAMAIGAIWETLLPTRELIAASHHVTPRQAIALKRMYDAWVVMQEGAEVAAAEND